MHFKRPRSLVLTPSQPLCHKSNHSAAFHPQGPGDTFSTIIHLSCSFLSHCANQRVQYVKWLSETLSSSLRSAAYCQVLTKMCLHCKRTRTITVQRTMPLTHSQMTARMKKSIVAGNTVLVSTGSANGGNWSVTIQTNCEKPLTK